MYSINYVETKNGEHFGEYEDDYIFESLEDVEYYLNNDGFKLDSNENWSKIDRDIHVTADIFMKKVYKRNHVV